jgi:hypothetical protein
MSTAVTLNGTGYTVPQMGETGWRAALDAYLLALATMRGGAMVFGISTGVTTAARYAPPGYGAAQTTEVQVSSPITGTARGLFVRCRTAPVGDTVVVTVRKAGAATAMTATIAIAGTTASDAANTFSVTAGDAFSVSVTGGASFSSGALDLLITFNITPN